MRETVDIIEKLLAGTADINVYADHPDWRLRYGAAVAAGETGDPKYLSALERILDTEMARRDLYTQPEAKFNETTDDTRMAEYIGQVEVSFGGEYSDEIKQQWQCRGRVKQAVMFAVAKIKKCTPSLLEKMMACIESENEYPVVASACVALRFVGSAGEIERLKALQGVDFCSSFELEKTIALRTAEFSRGAKM